MGQNPTCCVCAEKIHRMLCFGVFVTPRLIRSRFSELFPEYNRCQLFAALRLGPNRHVVPGRRFWRRPGSSGRRAGLNLIATLWGVRSSLLEIDTNLEFVANLHIVPVSRSWRRPGSAERRAGLKSIAPLWVEGSPSPDGSGQVRDRGSVQHGG